MDPSEYKHVALGLIFLKYISDAFEERREGAQKRPCGNRRSLCALTVASLTYSAIGDCARL